MTVALQVDITKLAKAESLHKRYDNARHLGWRRRWWWWGRLLTHVTVSSVDECDDNYLVRRHEGENTDI